MQVAAAAQRHISSGHQAVRPLSHSARHCCLISISMSWSTLSAALWAVPCSTWAAGMAVAAGGAFLTLLFGPVAPYGRCDSRAGGSSCLGQ